MNQSLAEAVKLLGIPGTAKAAGTTKAAVYKWLHRSRLPRSDHTGETHYATRIEAATNGAVKADELLAESLRVYQAHPHVPTGRKPK
jgi:hypothetical protein